MSDTVKKKVSISIKVSSSDKKRAAELFDSLGLNLSTAVNIFIKKSISEGGLPFDVKDPFYSETNQTELNKRFKEVESYRDVHSHQLLDNEN
ncbi:MULTISPECIES: type II toxin-antitoxin system RelB/DinJ family antitoxin [Lactobacillus]|uniref:Type II toxin-antitoxin system RelB/DinJ family antitoxin n=1 Tax=Lactobacillus panisapium TaxID=2012495 RepID=A0ABX8W7L4_9LACO|nr:MULTISPECIES: type II toxin-antitoxin system RelB/DinJ family antitoxin [Lactobacillus]MCO6534118.1 type II toxin-antitoxin system RelB/DinJ family antitoxin [Lactobacillus sp.]QYN53629.1 type II toxin-antitoxin system RelB/DinJ family antitoxin [Lactobacillus panisapium]